MMLIDPAGPVGQEPEVEIDRLACRRPAHVAQANVAMDQLHRQLGRGYPLRTQAPDSRVFIESR